MHICSIWNGVRCFKVLKAFGGLCLNIHDHYCKDPLATALDYRCKYIATSLKSLKSEYDSFMLINHEKINKPLDLKRLEKDEDVEEQKDALFDLQSMCTAIVKHSEE